MIANWYLEQNDEVFDGIYEIKFNNSNECIYFKSWEMMKKEVNKSMDMYQKKEMRKEEKMSENKKSLTSTSIN